MKGAVIRHFGDTPRYEDFPDPIARDGDVLVEVRAVVLENFDKLTAAGSHYSSAQMFPAFPAIVGHIGVGELEDGTLVAFGGTKPPFGTMAQKALVPKEYAAYVTPVPPGVNAALAAALPASALTSLLPLKYGVKLQPGQTVLINGATGVSGKVAVQIAKLLGAGRVVGTGRDESNLRAVMELGADAVIDTKNPDDEVQAAFRQEAGAGYDVVLDFLWGRPTELLLETLVPKEAGFAQHTTRFIQVGEAAGAAITLTAETLRSSGVQLSGGGEIPPEGFSDAMNQVWEWIQSGKLKMDIEEVPLRDISLAWETNAKGKRFVIIP